jgi:hypothetical protein
VMDCTLKCYSKKERYGNYPDNSADTAADRSSA